MPAGAEKAGVENARPAELMKLAQDGDACGVEKAHGAFRPVKQRDAELREEVRPARRRRAFNFRRLRAGAAHRVAAQRSSE